MKIFPAIDIKDGNCVRLTQGKFDQVTYYNNNPAAQAKIFLDHGFNQLHIVDLDGAKEGKRKNISQLNEILSLQSVSIQFGGGIRTITEAEHLIELGVNRVVVGTSAITNKTFTRDLLSLISTESITFALDFKTLDGSFKLASHGWQELTEVDLLDFIENFSPVNVLATDINRDGLLKGPSLEAYNVIKSKFPDINLIASGGISTLEDIKALKEIGIKEAIVGKAIYDKKISLEELALC